MKDDLLFFQRRAQWANIDICQWIDNHIISGNADLKQTKFFAITVQTVRFRVDRDAVERFELREEIVELRSGRDHFNPLNNSSALVLERIEVIATASQLNDF